MSNEYDNKLNQYEENDSVINETDTESELLDDDDDDNEENKWDPIYTPEIPNKDDNSGDKIEEYNLFVAVNAIIDCMKTEIKDKSDCPYEQAVLVVLNRLIMNAKNGDESALRTAKELLYDLCKSPHKKLAYKAATIRDLLDKQ